MMIPSLRDIVRSYGLLLNKGRSKSLGQNFLLEETIPRRIIDRSPSITGAFVFEVGPGIGSLTRVFFEKNPRHVVAVEKDSRCVQALSYLTDSYVDHLTLIHGDALTFSLRQLVNQYGVGDEKIHIIANLPYNISTVLLTQWFHELEYVHSMTLMFQKEVADRLVAQTNSEAYSRLSIVTQYCCQARVLFDVAPSFFTPSPKVVSTVVQLTPRQGVDKNLLCSLEFLTQKAFSNRRKMIRRTLKPLFQQEEWDELKSELSLRDEYRCEVLSPSVFVALAKRYKRNNG